MCSWVLYPVAHAHTCACSAHTCAHIHLASVANKLPSPVSRATSLQPQRREVCVKRLSRAVTAHRFVGLSPQADFTGDPVSSSCMGPTTQLPVPSAAGVAREEPAPSIQSHPAQHLGSPGPCWGPWAAHVTSLSSSFSDPIHSVYPVRRGLKGEEQENVRWWRGWYSGESQLLGSTWARWGRCLHKP